jgi:NACHT domain
MILSCCTDSQDRDTLDKLRPVTMDASSRIECLTDTRTGILKFIVDWVNSSASDQNILWLHGLAGSGKSTLSTTIANIFREDNLLGAFLFFDRDITERSDPTVVIRTLAYQLASSDHRIGAAIRAVIEEDSNIWLSPLSRQFRKLVVEPILTIANYLPTIIIILDGLDECGTPADRAALLDVLVKEFAGIPSYFRTVVTSRAESDICDAFNFQSHILPHELDIKSHVNYDDILLYIRHHMSLICSKNRHLQLGPNWPGEGILCQLVEQASGLFVWASTACEFINGYDPTERLEVILRAEATSGAQAALDAVYRTALESIGHWDDESFISDFRNLMGIILVTRQPLSSTAIDAFLHFPENRPSMHVISLLGCVLQQSPRVRVLHPSFADFLLDKERCGRDMWLFNQPIYHQHLAFYCLEQMDGALKRNMCNMTFSGTLTKDKLSEVASYSCLFWIDHICTISDDIAPVLDRVYGFLLQHLLHWFEAMSILNRAKDTILQLNKLYAWMTVSVLLQILN